jgi:hypothetical protein
MVSKTIRGRRYWYAQRQEQGKKVQRYIGPEAAEVSALIERWRRSRGEPRTRLRYFLALFAKEVVLRAHGVPGSDEALESLVEILAHAERNLASL